MTDQDIVTARRERAERVAAVTVDRTALDAMPVYPLSEYAQSCEDRWREQRGDTSLAARLEGLRRLIGGTR